jgi:hypothetical protein
MVVACQDPGTHELVLLTLYSMTLHIVMHQKLHKISLW